MNWQDKTTELFGEARTSALARLVGVSRKTARQWINDQRDVPQNVIDDVDATYEIWRGDYVLR